MPANALIVSSDPSFAATMRDILRPWGLGASHLPAPTIQDVKGMAVVLIDIRQQAEERVAFLAGVKERWPGVEAILINRADNIQPAIAGMRAGAADEIIAPFDTETLKSKILALLARQGGQKKRTLLQRFGDAMAAATFAQAGDFDTAIAMLDDPAEERPPGRKKEKKRRPGPVS